MGGGRDLVITVSVWAFESVFPAGEAVADVSNVGAGWGWGCGEVLMPSICLICCSVGDAALGEEEADWSFLFGSLAFFFGLSFGDLLRALCLLWSGSSRSVVGL